jgi:hypothetical protein
VTDPRNGKMTSLRDELDGITARLAENSLTDEELAKWEEEQEKREKQTRLHKAWQYIHEVGGERVVEVIKDKAHWRETEAVKALRLLKPGGCAFIQSEAGAGKTVAGIQYAGRMISQGYDARYVNAANLNLEAMFCEVLVIDELGCEFVSAFWLAAFMRVFDYRYSRKLTTVLLTNLILKDLAMRYDGVDTGSLDKGRLFGRVAQWSREEGSVFKEGCGVNLRLQTPNRAQAQK